MLRFLQRVIVIPDKLQTMAVAGILYLIVQLATLILNATGLDLTGVLVPLAPVLAGILTFLVKMLLERAVPERFHVFVNSFLAWLATIVVADLLFKLASAGLMLL